MPNIAIHMEHTRNKHNKHYFYACKRYAQNIVMFIFRLRFTEFSGFILFLIPFSLETKWQTGILVMFTKLKFIDVF